MKLKKTTWKQILDKVETIEVTPKYFAFSEKPAQFKPIGYAISFSGETARMFGEDRGYSISEQMFMEGYRRSRLTLPIFYHPNEEELAKKTLKQLVNGYGPPDNS